MQAAAELLRSVLWASGTTQRERGPPWSALTMETAAVAAASAPLVSVLPSLSLVVPPPPHGECRVPSRAEHSAHLLVQVRGDVSRVVVWWGRTAEDSMKAASKRSGHPVKPQRNNGPDNRRFCARQVAGAPKDAEASMWSRS